MFSSPAEGKETRYRKWRQSWGGHRYPCSVRHLCCSGQRPVSIRGEQGEAEPACIWQATFEEPFARHCGEGWLPTMRSLVVTAVRAWNRRKGVKQENKRHSSLEPPPRSPPLSAKAQFPPLEKNIYIYILRASAFGWRKDPGSSPGCAMDASPPFDDLNSCFFLYYKQTATLPPFYPL